MTLSVYDVSIPTFIRALTNLSAILDKGLSHAEAKKIDPTVFIQARLAPDMLPLSKQVQIASDVSKGCAARLAGLDIPKFEDTETSFPQLQERIAKTIAFLKSIKPEQLKNAATKTITLTVAGREITFDGQSYIFNFALPNVFFHVTTTYAILRHNGTELGKQDFLGQGLQQNQAV